MPVGSTLSSSGLSRASPSGADPLGLEAIKSELRRLSAANQEILKSFNAQSVVTPKPKAFGSSGNILLPAEAEQMAELKRDNEALKSRVAELETKLSEASAEGWSDQRRDFEQLLEDKSETIRTLNHHIRELTEELRGGGSGPSRDDLEALAAELRQRDEQLRADEDSLQIQVRETEMSMARERAEMARQKSQLQRLHHDLQHEIETANRDPLLRERLANLQRPSDARPKTMSALPGGPTTASKTLSGLRPGTTPALDSGDVPGTPETKGVFRRLFG